MNPRLLFFTAFAAIVSASTVLALEPTEPHVTAPSLEDRGYEEPEAIAAPAPGIIRAASVSALTADGFGTLDPGSGGVSDDIWKGSARATIDPILGDLHAGIANDTLRDLMTRLLMTKAQPPQGSGAQNWLAVRLTALVAMGQDDKAEQMLFALPESLVDASLLKLKAEIELTRGEYEPACQQTPPAASPVRDAFWQKLDIVCKARAGKQEEATVGIDLMREEHHVEDPFFQEAIRRIGDKVSPIRANPQQWSLLDVALLKLSGDSDKIKDRMEAFPAVSLKYIANDALLDIKIREKALTRAQLLGVLPENPGNKIPEQPFARPLASDVTTLVTALGSDNPPNDADRAVIARLAINDADISDTRRVQRLLTLMEPFGFSVPPEVWRKLYMRRERVDGEVPPASLMARLQDAAFTGKHGEMIALAGLIASGADLDRMSDLALLPMIRGLMAAGFKKEARMIAYSAVKSYSGH